jgi:hypothetical protein
MSRHLAYSGLGDSVQDQAANQHQAAGELSRTAKGTLAIAGLLCLWEGLPFTLVGWSHVLGYQIYAAIISAGTGWYVLKAISGRVLFTRWEQIALLLVGLCIAVSYLYSTTIRPQSLPAWAFHVYTVSPILLIFLMRAAGCTIGDALSALFWTGFVASFVLAVCVALDLSVLDYYLRGSTFGSVKRVVFFKLETAFCVVISAVRLAYARDSKEKLLYGVALGSAGYSLVFLSESRLAIVAVMGALGLTWLFVLKGKRKALIFLLAPAFVIPIAGYFVSKFLTDFRGWADYFANDSSAVWRQYTMQYFQQAFSETNGLGFGFMSGNPEYSNVISYGSTHASMDYGVANYSVSLDDIGILSALYQYGYAGFLLVVGMTVIAIVSLYRAKSLGRGYWAVSAVGMLMATFLLSPISMNYFTLFYTSHVGGVLWFMAAESSRLRRAAVSSVGMGGDPL